MSARTSTVYSIHVCTHVHTQGAILQLVRRSRRERLAGPAGTCPNNMSHFLLLFFLLIRMLSVIYRPSLWCDSVVLHRHMLPDDSDIVCPYACLYASPYACLYECLCACIYTCIFVHRQRSRACYARVCIHTSMHTRPCTCLYACLHACRHTC